MTETSLLPGVDSNDSGAGLLPGGPDAEPTDGGNRRRLIIIGAIAGVIVLAAAAYMLLHKSGGSSAPTGVVPHGTPHHAAPAKAKTGGHSGSKGSKSSKAPAAAAVPKTAKQQSVVDPFAPLVTAPVQTAGGPTSTTSVPASTGSASTSSQSTTSSGSATTTGNTKPSAPSPKWIQLMSVSGSSATFDVGYAHHQFRRYHVQMPTSSARQGTVFDTIFALLSIKNGAATVQIGDG